MLDSEAIFAKLVRLGLCHRRSEPMKSDDSPKKPGDLWMPGSLLGCPRKLGSKVRISGLYPTIPQWQVGCKPFTNHLLTSRDIQVYPLDQLL